ncbi:MAG: AMP-binding protein [Bacteroidota bacterium]
MPVLSDYYQPNLTLPDILRRAAAKSGDVTIGYLHESGNISYQTYSGLFAEASHIASGLVNAGLLQGDKLIIATQDNRETINLLWACFLCGIVPTVLQPVSTFTGYNPSVIKLMSVYEQLGKPAVFMSRMPDSEDMPDIDIRCISQLHCNNIVREISIDPSDTAFIQFSSGSTGDPKGVILNHINMVANFDAIRVGLDLNYPDTFGNWMPLFHDMGLIGYHLTPVYCGIYQWQIETIDFIKNPRLWLDLLSNQKINITGSPNFGLALMLRYLKRMKTRPEWDFSALKGLLNGAEPISVQIMNEFINELLPSGFRPEAMMPVYGMAEATLAVSFTPLLTPPVITAFDALKLDLENKAVRVNPDIYETRLLSGVGHALNDTEIRIVDNHDQPVDEGIAGHIQLKGAGITGGYFNKPEATGAAFCEGWLRTGDIGFFFEGNLYVSGRFKDIIFKNGRNYFANDLEVMACTLEDINYGKVCFGGTTNEETGHDKVIAFLAGSPGEKALETFRQLRNLLRANLGITVDELVMIKSNEIPKTSSGKLQRYKLMQRYNAGEFEGLALKAENT